MRTSLIADALAMAVATRGGQAPGVNVPQRPRVAVHLGRLRSPLRTAGRRAVDGGHRGVGTTAQPRAFFGTLKRELANRRRWATRADARRDLIRWIEGWYDGRWLHSSICYNSPVDHENLYYRHHHGVAA